MILKKAIFSSTLLLTLFLFLIPQMLRGQETISGNIYSAADSTALYAVSVYFDGTSIGTSTNKNGKFSIEKYSGAPLIISYLGYETVLVTSTQEGSVQLPDIYLQEKQQQLAEVVIEPDTWSRKKKLGIFRREFLGKNREASKSRIKNEDVLKLRYSPSTDKLRVTATEPLQIVNRHLGYEIRYDLDFFEVQFSTGTSGLRYPHMVSFQGFSFFEELRRRTRKKFLQNRESAYRGSSLHFMRALSKRSLPENNFQIFHEKFQVPPYEFFRFQQEDELLKVNLLTEKISILYNGFEQSGMQTVSPFYIDEFGNHTPPTAVIFSGKMSGNRIAHLLPLNYTLNNKK